MMEHLKMKNAAYETQIAYLINRISQQSEDIKHHDEQIAYLMNRIRQQSEDIRRHDEQIAYLINRISQQLEENGSHIGKLLCGHFFKENETPMNFWSIEIPILFRVTDTKSGLQKMLHHTIENTLRGSRYHQPNCTGSIG